MKIVLASESPRRKEILSNIGLSFESIPSKLDETKYEYLKPTEMVRKLAEDKAVTVSRIISDSTIVIGSDTVVVYKDKVLGKPKDNKDAYKLLKTLSGSKHRVYTGIALIDTSTGKKYLEHAYTNVYMRDLSDNEIKFYINSGEPLDKAGGYGIQGIGSILINYIEGDFYTVMGFPILKFYEGLRCLGYNLYDLI